MGDERRLAKGVVAAFGQPHFPQLMHELVETVGNPNTAWYHLGKVGMREAMLDHARELRRQGQPSLASTILQEVGFRFGNSAKKPKKQGL